MKFLHLSDLHIGKTISHYSMIAEQKHIFKQIIEYIKTESPQAVIIAGDIYDRAVPSVEAVRLFDDFITNLSYENIAVLLISGNHDSPERINYASRLLSDKHMYFYGAFDGSMHKIILYDEYGEVNFWLLPFIKHSMVYNTIKSSKVDYSARNILVSHQFYTKAGINPIKSDSELDAIGGLDAIDAGIIEYFDYAALGHLHRRQTVGSKHIRYCGSPVKYSFSEVEHKKSITLIEIGKKGDLSGKNLPLYPIYDMREITGEFNEIMKNEISLDYIRVVRTDKEEIIDIMNKLRSVYPNIVDVEPCKSIDLTTISIGKIEKLSPYDLFAEFFLQVQGFAMSNEQSNIIKSILERTEE